jgi:hypothetical protein
MHVHVAGPGRTCTLLLASLLEADNQQDAGYCALSIDLCGAARAVFFSLVGTETNTRKGKMFCTSKFGLAESFYGNPLRRKMVEKW